MTDMTDLRFPVDVSAWIGSYPFRDIPHPDADVLVRVLQRERIGKAWVGALPGAWHRDPSASNAWLYAQLAPHTDVLLPSPTVRPDWPGWLATLDEAVSRGAASVRFYPMQLGISATSASLPELASACGERGLVLQLTVRFEDLRQRHPMDSAADLTAAHVRALVRADPRLHVVISGAGRDLIEETHWSLTPAEQPRCYWDWAWVWGPPEDHFAHLLETIGHERFVFGGYWPLRLIQAPLATLALTAEALPGNTLATGNTISTAARATLTSA
jgi:Amidohydrolase